MPRSISDLTKKRMQLWDASKNAHEIRAIFDNKGIGFNGYGQIFQFARNHGLIFHKSYGERLPKILAFFSDNPNFTIQECSDITGINYHYVGQVVRLKNIPYAVHKEARLKRNFNKEVIGYLRNKNFTYDSIGRLFNVSRQRVKQIDESVVFKQALSPTKEKG